MVPVPFRISDTFAGFGRCEGMVRLEDGKLFFEFQSKLAGILKSTIKNVKSPLSELAKIEFQKGFFKNRIHVHFKSLKHATKFPKADGNEVILEIRRRDRDAGDRLVTEVKEAMVAGTLDEMLEMTEEALG